MVSIDLGGKVAIVTGASSGIGAETAQVMAACGARVIAVGRDEQRLQAVVDGIAQDGGDATAVVADLADLGTVEAILEAAGPRIDILALAAGQLTKTPFAEVEERELDELFSVHVKAPYFLTQSALERLSDGATVLFYSSTVTQSGFAPYSAYTAVKGAVDAMARSLAVELAPRVRVNTLAPGFTDTPMVGAQIDAWPELHQALVARTPCGFLGGPQSIAFLAAYLASDMGAYVDGSRLVVDGGWTAAGWQTG
ncbi:MAG TPA: SDR family oxidoreductase [Capillimicrobium sp.]|jgi:NAD(P)-dependent dehydrogenase (short-subunit alcohol dehydrogenase family)